MSTHWPQFKNQQGFNVIEVLIMISLVTLTFVAIMSLVIKNVQLEYLTKNDYVAVSLVKEGLDLTEEIRNDNIVEAQPFFQDITCANPPTCNMPPPEGFICYFRVDYLDSRTVVKNSRLCFPAAPPTPPTVSEADYLLQFDTNYYQHQSGDLSRFHRLITTVYHQGTTSGPYLDVKAELYWDYKGQGYNYTLETKLFDEN